MYHGLFVAHRRAAGRSVGAAGKAWDVKKGLGRRFSREWRETQVAIDEWVKKCFKEAENMVNG